ncbi:MAG: hypothetical protein V7K89_24920 [Nostoc sp.]|uniref:hypothetical protein n=1 Tax=Nostoc sp. TaxID=1180 RepID=UPI002FF7F652
MVADDQGREFVPPPSMVVERDKSERERLAICTDWSNHSTAWLMRHRLGLRAVLMDLMAGVEIKGDEAMIQVLADFSKRNASHVKGILISDHPTIGFCFMDFGTVSFTTGFVH